VGKARKYTDQFGSVMTGLQHELIKATDAADPAIEGKAEVVRAGINMLFGLDPADETALPEGQTFDETVARALAVIKPERNAPVV